MEKTSDDKKRLRSLVSALQKSVECPVCLEPVKPPFKVCVRGHSVCLNCIKKLEKCPLCQELFTLENLVCLTNVLEALPRLCCYTDAGCEEVVEPGNDHERFCGFRPIACRNLYCSEKMPVVKCLDHFKSKHPERHIVDKTSTGLFNPRGYQRNLKTFWYTPIFLFNNLFWFLQLFDAAEKQLYMFFQATPIGKLDRDYYARVTLEKDEFMYAYTIKAQVLSSCEFKFDGKNDERLDKEYCMKIPEKELHNFIHQKQGSMQFKLTVFEK